ncbi:CBF/Mak21 family-domain-containing protein, partial [Piptocephalis cylindrospora]
WYTVDLAPLTTTSRASRRPVGKEEVQQRVERAQELLETEGAQYEKKGSSLNRGDKSFFKTLMTSGTMSDKVSALVLLIQESPIHTARTMETLLGMARKRHRKEATLAIGALKDLLLSNLLPDRKLTFLQDQALSHPRVTDSHLLAWAYEDTLKRQYLSLIQTIEALSHDPFPHVRQAMVGHVYELLAGKPEQEQNLLALLVNKLGDLDKKVASRSTYLIHSLLVKHPNMKDIIIGAVQEHLFRKGMSLRAQYYGVLSLNQMILTASPDDQVAANHLVDVYFAIFRKILLKRKEKPAILTQTQDTSGKANRKAKKRAEDADRAADVEAELESKIISAVLTGINRAFPFAKLAADSYDQHIDTLFRVTHTGTFNVVVQALRLLFQVTNAHQHSLDRYYRVLYDVLIDPRLIHSSKQALFLNLLFKSLKADDVLDRCQAFVKRLLQISPYHQIPFICGVLYLTSEVIKAKPALTIMLTQSEMTDDDGEEHFVDVPESDDDEEENKEDTKKSLGTKDGYDGFKRDPRYAQAGRSCLWELTNLTACFHPSVARLAEKLLGGETIQESPQLQIHTLTHFLDKFVYRNPKKTATTKGSSLMQPQGDASHMQNTGGGIMWRKGGAQGGATVRDSSFVNLDVNAISADEVFFHKYFTARKLAGKDKKKGAKASEEEGKADDGGDESFDEDEVWGAMQSSMRGFDDMMAADEDEEGEDEDEDDAFMEAMAEDGEEGEEEEEDEEDEEDEFEMEGGDEEFGIEDEGDLMPSDEEQGQVEEQEEEEESRKKKRKKVALPTFASFDDYAAMINQLDDDEEA